MSFLFSFRNVIAFSRHLPTAGLLRSNFHTSPVSRLFSPAALGIDSYSQTRQRVLTQFLNLKDKFIDKMKEFVTDDPKNIIFTEDLKNMVHIASTEDLPLVSEMIKKFNTQSAEYRFGSFVFGPVVMRMYHYLNAPQEALEVFEATKSTGYFNQLSSYQILMDLLFRNERYQDMFDVFEHVKMTQLHMSKYPKNPVTLIMAACYKQNTKESLEYASQLMTEINNTGVVPLRKACCFLAGLALNQGAPHIAIEVISGQKQHYVTVRNIKAVALAEMGRIDDALPVLRTVLDIDIPSQKDKHTFLAETLERVKFAVAELKNKDYEREFNMIENALRERNLIDSNLTLDALLSQEVQATRPVQSQGQTMLHASYQGSGKIVRPNRQRENMY